MHLAIPNKSHPVLWNCTAAWERDERPPRLYMDRQVRRKTSVRFSRAKPMPPPRFIHKLIDAAGGRRRPSGRQMSLRIKRRDRPFSSFTSRRSPPPPPPHIRGQHRSSRRLDVSPASTQRRSYCPAASAVAAFIKPHFTQSPRHNT